MTRDSRLATLTCVLTVCATSCDSAAGTARSTVTDSAGVRIVESSAPVWDEASAWQMADQPTVEIGAIMGAEPAYEFTLPTSMTRLSDGRIVVLEAQSAEIRIFGPDGEHLVTAGGQGGGPGEFNYASRLWRGAGDTIIVEDRPSPRYFHFSPDGEYVRMAVVDQARLMEMGPWAECMSGSLPDGSMLMCRPEAGQPPARPDPGPGHLRSYTRFVRTTMELDTVIPLGRYAGIEQWGIDVGGRTEFAVHPFHSRTALAFGGSPLRIAIATNPEYSIELWTPDGELDQIIRRTGARHAATAEDRELAAERLRSYASDEAVGNRFVAEIPTPELAPAVISMVIDAENHLWVRRHVELARTAPVYDIFEPSGEYLGELVLPDRFYPFEIGSDYVLGAFRDENDVPFVRMYNLQRGT